MGWPVNNPNSSRLIDWGHSWVAPPSSPYASSDIDATTFGGAGAGQGIYPWNGEQWPWALRDALGIGTGLQFTRTYQVPAITTATQDVTTFLDYMPEDGTIDSVWYVPNGTMTATITNNRSLQFIATQWNAQVVFGGITFTTGSTGVSGVQGTAIRVWSINDETNLALAPPASGGGVAGTINGGSPYITALRGVGSSSLKVNQELYWTSVHNGSGMADTGGTVIVRYGTRYRNYGVVGALLLSQGSPALGNWLTALAWAAPSKPNGVEINLNANQALNSGTLAFSATDHPVPSGAVITFPGGVTFTTSAAINFGGTSVSGTGPTGALTNGQQGQTFVLGGSATAPGVGETLSPQGIHTWTHGVNDADNPTQDVNAWQETVRSVIARCLSPAWEAPFRANFVYANGGGAWNNYPTTPPLLGMPTLPDPINYLGAGLPVFTGATTGSPSFTATIGPHYEGGTLAVMFLALAGSSLGVAGTITVDGSTPPQGSVTINTSGCSTSGIATRTDVAISASATNTVTGVSTNFTAADIGKTLIATGTVTGALPAGTIITAVASTTSITIRTPAGTAPTFTATTCQVSGYYPMVKRITGLTAGSHTVTFTVTGSDSTANSAIIVYGIGIESVNPPTPLLWCNIARCPSQTAGQKTNSVALNTASSQVIAGTYTPLSGNTTEPAFGANVQYVDIDTLFGQSASYFIDGLHFNSRGHRLMARTLFNRMQAVFSPDELIAR